MRGKTTVSGSKSLPLTSCLPGTRCPGGGGGGGDTWILVGNRTLGAAQSRRAYSLTWRRPAVRLDH